MKIELELVRPEVLDDLIYCKSAHCKEQAEYERLLMDWVEAEATASGLEGDEWDRYVKASWSERRYDWDYDRPTIDGEHLGVRYWIEWGQDHTGTLVVVGKVPADWLL